MTVINETELAHLLKTGSIDIHEVIKVLHYLEVLKSLLELKNVKNLQLDTRLNERQVLEICIDTQEAHDSQLDLCPDDQSALTTVLVDAVEDFNVRLDSYTHQIFKQTCTHVDAKFANALKSIAKLDEQSLRFGDIDVELPAVDATIFKNIDVEPPLQGKGKASLLSFDNKILYITPERSSGHKFKRIEVTLTKQQVYDLVEKSFENSLDGNYVLKRNLDSYELVSFEVVQMTLDF